MQSRLNRVNKQMHFSAQLQSSLSYLDALFKGCETNSHLNGGSVHGCVRRAYITCAHRSICRYFYFCKYSRFAQGWMEQAGLVHVQVEDIVTCSQVQTMLVYYITCQSRYIGTLHQVSFCCCVVQVCTYGVGNFFRSKLSCTVSAVRKVIVLDI